MLIVWILLEVKIYRMLMIMWIQETDLIVIQTYGVVLLVKQENVLDQKHLLIKLIKNGKKLNHLPIIQHPYQFMEPPAYMMICHIFQTKEISNVVQILSI